MDHGGPLCPNPAGHWALVVPGPQDVLCSRAGGFRGVTPPCLVSRLAGRAALACLWVLPCGIGTWPHHLCAMCTRLHLSLVPWPSLSVGMGRFAGAAVGTVMHRCFGLSRPQFRHLRCSYHGVAAGEGWLSMKRGRHNGFTNLFLILKRSPSWARLGSVKKQACVC